MITKFIRLLLICFLSVLCITQTIAQNKRPLEYSKTFDVFYRKGDLKFTLEPGLSYLMGDLKPGMAPSIGLSANYTVDGPVNAAAGLRYFILSASEDGSTTTGIHYQLNLLGQLYIRYDKVRTNYDRRKKTKFWNLYALTGLSISNGAVVSSEGASGGFRFNIPLGIGVPLKISDRVRIVPEFTLYYTLSDKLDALALTAGSDMFMLASIGIEYNHWGKKKNINMRKRGNMLEDGMETEGNGDSPASTPPKDDNVQDIDEPEEQDTPVEPSESVEPKTIDTLDDNSENSEEDTLDDTEEEGEEEGEDAWGDTP